MFGRWFLQDIKATNFNSSAVKIKFSLQERLIFNGDTSPAENVDLSSVIEHSAFDGFTSDCQQVSTYTKLVK